MIKEDVIVLPVTPEILVKTQRNVVKKYNFTCKSLMYSRTPVELLDNLYMGDLAKNALYDYLLKHCKSPIIDYDDIRTDNFEQHDPGWDIMVGTKKLKVEIKSSTPPKGESIDNLIALRDIKITASHDKGKTWIAPNDLESDIHVQVYFYATPYRNGISSFSELSKVITEDYTQIESIINSPKYNKPLFLGYNTKENILEHLRALKREGKELTWTFSWTDRIYWRCPIRLALNMQSLINLIDEELDVPHIIPLYPTIPLSARYQTHLPYYSVKVACGAFVEGGIPEEVGWINTIEQGIKANTNRFIVQASGDSMLPKIHSGDYCVFERNWAGTRNGQIVLVQSREYDPDYSGKYTIKKYHSETTIKDEWETQKTIELIPLNPDYETIHLSGDEDVAIIGVLVGIIQGGELEIIDD